VIRAMAEGTPISEYDFKIPPHLIAQRPRPFGSQKLLVYNKSSGSIEHKLFDDLPKMLVAGDVIVLNDTKVIPAQIRTEKGTCVLFLHPMHDHSNPLQVIMSENLPNGTTLSLPNGASLTVLSFIGGDPPVHVVQLTIPTQSETLVSYLDKNGEMPLPPYVERPPDATDISAYQTSVAKHPGAVAAPTAGLHFHPELLEKLKIAGVKVITLTLHVGYGTFRSFGGDFVEQHKMDSETFFVSSESVKELWTAKKEKRRIISVGTTSTRVLESLAPVLLGPNQPGELKGEATIFIHPPYLFKFVDALVTNFHYPKTSVLTLTSAFVGSRKILIDVIYKEALENDYLWYSYGDGMIAF
jgi:S-adenosylmethionine:tRNA ribosyltransferase-isomerase